MTIVWLILKIIGWIILSILGLILLIVALVLLAPVHYKLSFESEETIQVEGKIRWLWPLVSLQLAYKDKKLYKCLRILGIKIPLEKKSKTKKRKEKQAVSTEESSETVEKVSAESEEKEETPALEEISKKEKKKFSIKEKIQNIVTSIKDKIAHIKDLTGRILKEIEDENNRKAVGFVFEQLGYLLRHFGPRKFKGAIQFGTADPATTGQVLGIISMAPFVYKHPFVIQPDFNAEKFYIKGTASGKGHIRAIHVLVVAIRGIRNKNIKKIIKRFL